MVKINSPNVDVVLAVYNGANFLEKQIYSIYNQSYKPSRLIIRDDCSSDSSRDILLKCQKIWPDWIQILSSNNRLGCVGNFSTLLEATQSSYIALADQDDLWDYNKIERCMKECLVQEEILGNNLPILVHSDFRLIDYKGNIVDHSFFKYQALDYRKVEVDQLLIQNVVTGCSVLVNRSLLDLALPIPSQFVLHDLWLALIASRFGRISFIDDSLFSYRQHKANQIGAIGNHFKYFKSRIIDFLNNNLWHRIDTYFNNAKIFHQRYKGRLPNLIKFERASFTKKILMLRQSIFKKKGLHRQFLFLLLLFIRALRTSFF